MPSSVIRHPTPMDEYKGKMIMGTSWQPQITQLPSTPPKAGKRRSKVKVAFGLSLLLLLSLTSLPPLSLLC